MPLLLTDLDDTLISRKAAFLSWAESFASRYGLRDGAVSWLVDHDFDGRESRERFFERVAERWKLPTTPGQLADAYRGEFSGHFQPLAGETVDAMMGLRAAGWKVAVVTNGDRHQLRKMEATGVIALVDAWCISEEAGVPKPDLAIFELAARRCGITLDGGWMIGDQPEADIRGGRGAGLRTVWLRHGRTWDQEDYAPDLAVDTFPEAIAAIRRSTSRLR